MASAAKEETTEHSSCKRHEHASTETPHTHRPEEASRKATAPPATSNDTQRSAHVPPLDLRFAPGRPPPPPPFAGDLGWDEEVPPPQVGRRARRSHTLTLSDIGRMQCGGARLARTLKYAVNDRDEEDELAEMRYDELFPEPGPPRQGPEQMAAAHRPAQQPAPKRGRSRTRKKGGPAPGKSPTSARQEHSRPPTSPPEQPSLAADGLDPHTGVDPL